LQTKFSKTAYLAIMQQNISVKEQINITTPFYDEISKYSQSILAILQALNSEKCIANFVKIGDANFVATNVKNTKQRRKTFTFNTSSWLRHVFKIIRPVYASILLF
jgi:hypothetical protein